jgi:uncharacterized protein YkwD
MCVVLLPVYGGAADTQSAGSVKAMIPDASRNAHPLSVNDPLQWNDLLQTDAKGRVRAGLNDGSILSLGSNSQLKIVQHDAAAQQTQIDLTYGKLRNQVTKITQPQGKYQVKTSNAVIGVIGTDFYVGYVKGRTTVICYEGRVSVTPLGDAKVLGSTNAAAGADGGVVLRAGQIVIIGPKLARDETLLYPVLMQQGQDDTEVSAPAGNDSTGKTNAAPTKDEVQLADLVNQTRAEKGLPPLSVDPRLTDAARKHDELMADSGALSHQFPGEPPLQQRIDEENIPTDLEAENVGWDVNVVSAHQSLVDDPPHLRNILDPECNVVGIAVIRRGNHVFVTEDFAHKVPEKSQP